MERTAHFGWFAERYHWTAEQTMAQNPAWLVDRLPAFAALVDEVRAEKERAK